MAGLSWFNALDEASARKGLARCCGEPAWVDRMIAARPFESVDALQAHARRAWSALDAAAWRSAFARHPRIGDRDAMRARFAGSWSAGEQSGAASASDETIGALVDGNREYERRFGHVFVVCATGKTADEMLALLRARLSNPPDVELRIAADEHAKITALRIEKLLNEAVA
jgi:2-oxo-4-hydroxy-4-carboxy-5-ureidoimidazoline decarboxylase